jgi:hypothetical protein
MDTPEKNSKPLSPAAAICIGVLLFVMACLIFWSIISGLLAGQTYSGGRNLQHELVIRKDAPIAFWFWTVARFIGAVMLYLGAVMIFISSFRRIRRK